MKNCKSSVYTVKKYIRALYMINIEIHHIKNLFILFMISVKLLKIQTLFLVICINY